MDWHDWDVSNPPAVIKTIGGKKLMAVSPNDGHLYGFDLADSKLLYRTPVTRIENVEEPFAVDKDVHFCPGAGGGEEWNSPAYDSITNLILTPDVDWCITVRLQTREEIEPLTRSGSHGRERSPSIRSTSLERSRAPTASGRAGFTQQTPTRGCGSGG
jgi:hypothetical protein